MEKRLLKTNEAAKYLGVSRSSLTNWVKQGLLGGGATPGGHYRFTVEELDQFADGRGLLKPGFQQDASHRLRILLVDDDEGFREFVKDALEVFSGFELKEAFDGMKGAMIVGAWRPDLILLDIRMPNMNGVDFLKHLRENPESAETDVIVASAHLSPEVRAELERLEADIILEKPVRLAKLVASIQKLADLKLA